ncbi:hypothetical protein SPH9361_04936 [Sphingobium sp. CECT 9361]|nr:hypothetical protein SPH9361_04936 [Sphingobium sp. CECT 9361]
MTLLSCSSAQRDYLKPFGYGTLALPKASTQPLLMLAKRGDRLTPIGPLGGTLVPGAVPLPAAARGPVASITGAQSKSLDASLALDVLGSAIGALAGSSLGLKAAYKSASTVEFEFGEVNENRVDFNALDSFLAAASPLPAIGPALQKMLENDEVFVITATVDAKSITVKGKKSDGTDLGLDVPVVQQLVGAKVSVGSTGAQSSVLTYTSTDMPLTIGAEVVRLFFRNGRYQAAKLVKPTPLAGKEKEAEAVAPDQMLEL